jgi:hypothetical protein
MIGAQELFKSFIELDTDVHVEIGMGTKNAIKGCETIPFQMDLSGLLIVMDMLWVPKLRRSLISVSMIENKIFDVAF